LIFVDSNIPMYLVGAEHPHKTEARVLLERLTAAGQQLVTDAEVLQEILHRYISIDLRNTIDRAFDVLLKTVDDVFPVEKSDVLRAAEIAQHRAPFSARDAVHIAIMEHHGVHSILSFDADFDRWPGLKRIHAI
jgi:predicted nucleic acid-binding protein